MLVQNKAYKFYTWVWGPFWIDFLLPKDQWYWSIHSWPCCILFFEAGPLVFSCHRYWFTKQDKLDIRGENARE